MRDLEPAPVRHLLVPGGFILGRGTFRQIGDDDDRAPLIVDRPTQRRPHEMAEIRRRSPGDERALAVALGLAVERLYPDAAASDPPPLTEGLADHVVRTGDGGL